MRDELGAVIEARKAELDRVEIERKLAAGRIDVTQPGRGQQPGGLHPVSRTRRRVEALFAYADRLEARHTAARAQVEKLTPATLAKAFRGELVPQDPNDEPASKLLERIRANSVPAPTKSGGRKQKNKGAVS